MKNRILLSGVYILIGLLVILAPRTFFAVCSGEMKMSCNYTADAESGIGIAVILLGMIFLFLAPCQIRLGISIAQAVNGILMVLFPTCLIGVCQSKEMMCHMATLPFLVIMGVLLIALSVGNSVYLLRKESVKAIC